ncbi:Ldhc [Acrasis kona]|uniref:Ldhc n=1 Tax=Acrasis kona TaxID=1008807 RepID=A0AAW2Z6W9_9EUKA
MPKHKRDTIESESDDNKHPKKMRKTKKTNKRQPVSEESKKAKKQRDEAIEAAKKENSKNGVRGRVRCNKLPHRFDKTLKDKSWPVVKGFKNINVCSGAPGAYKNLSPMKLGPIEYNLKDDGNGEEGTILIKNLENCWQFSKVWNGEEDKRTKLPVEEFWARRKTGWEDEKAHRWVKKGNDENGNKNIPLYSYWKGQKLSYLQARGAIYCPLYAALVQETDAYKKLKKLVDEGTNVQILGFDGYDYDGEGMSLADCYKSTRRPFGHEHVLCALLSGEHVWCNK